MEDTYYVIRYILEDTTSLTFVRPAWDGTWDVNLHKLSQNVVPASTPLSCSDIANAAYLGHELKNPCRELQKST